MREAVGRRAGVAERKVHHAAGVYFPNRAHRARIAIKKLRYLAELLEKTERVRKPSVRALRNAQEALGSIHDREMVLGRLSDLMEEEDLPGARELARVLEAECRSIFEDYRSDAFRGAQGLCGPDGVVTTTGRATFASAPAGLWRHRSAVGSRSARDSRAACRVSVSGRRASPCEIDLRAIPEARPAPVVR